MVVVGPGDRIRLAIVELVLARYRDTFERIAAGKNVVIVANSVVLTDVPDNTTIMGVPARIKLPGGRPKRFFKVSEVIPR